MGQAIRALNQTQHGIKLRLTPDRHEVLPTTWRPSGGRLWHVATILMVVMQRLGRHIAPLIQLWNDYAIGNLDERRVGGREHPATTPRTIAAPPNTPPDPAPAAKPRAERWRPEPLPQAKSWLSALCRHTAVAAVERCVNAPEMQAFVLAVPEAARHLRPICTVLQIPIPLYLKRRATPDSPQAEPQPDSAPETNPAAPDTPPPIIHKLVPDPRHAHPGWRNYITVSGRLRA
jgi:hypothetical protein